MNNPYKDLYNTSRNGSKANLESERSFEDRIGPGTYNLP